MEGAIMDWLTYIFSKKYTDRKIAAIASAAITPKVVATLPATGEARFLYLVPQNAQGEQNYYDEYLYIDEKWEMIGTTKIDLSEYYSKAEVDAMFANVNGYVATASTSDISDILYGEGDK